MAAYDNLYSFLSTTLTYPTQTKCEKLGNFVEAASIRELQEIFPRLVHDVFGVDTVSAVGWGLRTVTKNLSMHEFSVLRNFFCVNGIMFRFCHRLLLDGIKFEISTELIPPKVVDMFQSGSLFYTELINVDPYTRRVVSLTVNAFDFYILHFVLHGLQPLHRMNPLALQIHNERLQSVYFDLTYDYLNNFMPGYNDVEVMPPLMCSTLKAPQVQLQMQTLETARKPRYLKMPVSYDISNMTNILNMNALPGGPRAYTWRTESVLHFFVDIWLRYDVEGQHDLPGSELVRNVRALIKQTHFFANALHMDTSAMVPLRKIAQPMIKGLTFQFLRGLIDRWPLDGSMTVVLELWISYIQPWRYNAYTYNSQNRNREIVVTNQYDNFIADNLMMYTQIFWRLLSRFQRLDYSIYGNAFMLYRMAKVLSQPGLGHRIYEVEKTHNNSSYGGCESSSPRQSSFNRNSTMSTNDSRNTNLSSYYNDMIPCSMFSENMCREIENLLNIVNVSRINILRTIRQLTIDMMEKKTNQGYIKNIFLNLLGEKTEEELILLDIGRIPEMLNQSITALSNLFRIPLSSNFQANPNKAIRSLTPPLSSNTNSSFSFYDSYDNVDMSKITPLNMSHNSSKQFPPPMDPALMPIKCNEFALLVKLLHCISDAINTKFGSQLKSCYERNDILGKLLRQILYEPTTIQWFDGVSCHNEIYEDLLPPRLCLRSLASFPVLTVIAISLVFGSIVSSPFIGLMTLSVLYACYIFVLALFS